MKINKGDTIGIIALSGDCDKDKIEQAKTKIESLGYKVKLSKNIYDKNKYLAGSDDDKINELHRSFTDPEIKLILCARGGYGAIRLINQIDYNLIKNNPKPFCGFSDATALLLMIYKRAGIVTYHSPMALTMNSESDFEKLFTSSTQNEKTKSYNGSKIYFEGDANGVLWGGNLSTVVSLCGQDFLPDKDFIFFAEDVNEPVYKIDKMFQQLINIKEFTNKCKGIVLGEFLGVDNETWLEEYFTELANRLQIPIVGGFKITHGEGNIVVPIGVQSEIIKSILTSCASG